MTPRHTIAIKERARAFYKEHLGDWISIGKDLPEWTSSSASEYQGHKDLLDVFQRHLPGPRVLGAGCGPVARDLRFLAQRGCHPTVVDVVPENVENARLVTKEDVTYQTADLTEPPLRGINVSRRAVPRGHAVSDTACTGRCLPSRNCQGSCAGRNAPAGLQEGEGNPKNARQ